VCCKRCSTKNTLKIKASDRVEFKKRYGCKIDLTCKKCNAMNKYEISDIKAEHRFDSSIFFIITIAFIVLITWFLWSSAKGRISYSFGFLPIGISIPLLVFSVFTKVRNDKVRNFNKS
jgi:hypothetical protein